MAFNTWFFPPALTAHTDAEKPYEDDFWADWYARISAKQNLRTAPKPPADQSASPKAAVPPAVEI